MKLSKQFKITESKKCIVCSLETTNIEKVSGHELRICKECAKNSKLTTK